MTKQIWMDEMTFLLEMLVLQVKTGATLQEPLPSDHGLPRPRTANDYSMLPEKSIRGRLWQALSPFQSSLAFVGASVTSALSVFLALASAPPSTFHAVL